MLKVVENVRVFTISKGREGEERRHRWFGAKRRLRATRATDGTNVKAVGLCRNSNSELWQSRSATLNFVFTNGFMRGDEMLPQSSFQYPFDSR